MLTIWNYQPLTLQEHFACWMQIENSSKNRTEALLSVFINLFEKESRIFVKNKTLSNIINQKK